MDVRFNWFTRDHRYHNVDPYSQLSRWMCPGPQPLIKKKKVILKNDYIHHVVDIYHV